MCAVCVLVCVVRLSHICQNQVSSAMAELKKTWQPIRFTVRALDLISRPDDVTPFSIIASVPLGQASNAAAEERVVDTLTRSLHIACPSDAETLTRIREWLKTNGSVPKSYDKFKNTLSTIFQVKCTLDANYVFQQLEAAEAIKVANKRVVNNVTPETLKKLEFRVLSAVKSSDKLSPAEQEEVCKVCSKVLQWLLSKPTTNYDPFRNALKQLCSYKRVLDVDAILNVLSKEGLVPQQQS